MSGQKGTWSGHENDAQPPCHGYGRRNGHAVESKGNYDPNNRGEVRVFVSHGPGKAERNVVQFTAGYKHKKHSDVTVNIDGKKFTLFTIEGRAYAESEEDDIAMIRAMKRGSKMTVVGTSSRGTKTTDTYSLSGFTKTKNLIDKTCS